MNDQPELQASMHCFECAKLDDAVPAVAVCQHCGVGLCLDHLIDARQTTVGGANYGCAHTLPTTKRLRGVPAGIAGAMRHHGAAGAS